MQMSWDGPFNKHKVCVSTTACSLEDSLWSGNTFHCGAQPRRNAKMDWWESLVRCSGTKPVTVLLDSASAKCKSVYLGRKIKLALDCTTRNASKWIHELNFDWSVFFWTETQNWTESSGTMKNLRFECSRSKEGQKMICSVHPLLWQRAPTQNWGAIWRDVLQTDKRQRLWSKQNLILFFTLWPIHRTPESSPKEFSGTCSANWGYLLQKYQVMKNFDRKEYLQHCSDEVLPQKKCSVKFFPAKDFWKSNIYTVIWFFSKS